MDNNQIEQINAKIKLVKEYNLLLAKETRLLKKLQIIRTNLTILKIELNEKL